MGKKFIFSHILCTSLLVSSCGLKNPYEAETVVGARTMVQKSVQVEAEGVTDQEMKVFFSKLLEIDHETLLLVNQKPQEVNDQYWGAYKSYENIVQEILGDYLAASAKSKLKKQYLHDDFHFPRFVQLNDYMITGIADVLDASITAKRKTEDSTIYEVAVLARAHVIDLDWAKKKYQWDHDKGYYGQEIFLESGNHAAQEPGLDQIRVSMNYILQVPEGDGFTVMSLREKTGLHFGIDEKGHIKNNDFMTRLAFKDEITGEEEAVIHKFLQMFLNEDYNFYGYYRKAHGADFDTFRSVLERDLNLKKIVALSEDTYKQQFEPSIIPLKDNMESLSFDLIEDVEIRPHLSSSAKNSSYQVLLKANVTLINGSVVPYEYSYLFILDQEAKIRSVRLITQQEVKAEDLDLEDEAE